MNYNIQHVALGIIITLPNDTIGSLTKQRINAIALSPSERIKLPEYNPLLARLAQLFSFHEV